MFKNQHLQICSLKELSRYSSECETSILMSLVKSSLALLRDLMLWQDIFNIGSPIGETLHGEEFSL